MEKRFYPRVATDLPAVIANDDGVLFNVRALDASSDGLSIECNIRQRNLVTPGGSFVREDGKPVELSVSLDLPDGNGATMRIEARCHIAFSRRIAKNKCKIGMRYTQLEETNYKNLVRFIETSLNKSSVVN